VSNNLPPKCIDTAANNLPVNESFIFADDKGNHKNGIEKRQRKLLAKLDFLKKFILNGEQIQIVTQALSPFSFFEQFLGGKIFLTQKRSLLVFTNMRILHIPTDSQYKYKQSIAEIIYTDCKNVTRKNSCLLIEYKDGSKENFRCMGRQERKRISLLLGTIDTSKSETISAGRKHLCPECTATLENGNYNCHNCKLEFKTKSAARKMAFLFPGGGYFYTGYYWIGFGDFLAEILIPVLAFGFLLQFFRGAQDALFPFILFTLIFIAEKITSISHANKNVETFIPVRNGKKPNILLYSIISLAIYAILFPGIYFLQEQDKSYFENYNATLNSSLAAGDYNTAAELTIKAIAWPLTTEEEAISLYTALINIYEECGQFDKAAHACQDNIKYMISSGYQDAEVKDTVTARKSLFENNIPQAIILFQACDNRYADHFVSNFYLGDIFLGNYGQTYKDYAAALKYNLKAFTLERTHLAAGMNLGINYISLKEYDKALEIFKELYSKAEDNAWICYYLGQTYNVLNQKEQGETYINKAIQLNPEILKLMQAN